MHISALPNELLQQLFQLFVRGRTFKRAMRLRLVSRQFQRHTNEVIFRSRVLDGKIDRYDLRPQSWEDAWVSYFQTYLAYHIFIGVDRGCRGDHIRLIAERVCELAGGLGEDSLLSCIRSVCTLIYFEDEQKVWSLIESDPAPAPGVDQLDADILDAAVYLNNINLVTQLLRTKPELGWKSPDIDRNLALEKRLEIASYHGNLEMVKLLLAADPALQTTSTHLAPNLARRLFRFSCRPTQGHCDIFNFILDSIDPDIIVAEEPTLLRALLSATDVTTSLENYKRGAMILNPEFESSPIETWGRFIMARLYESAFTGSLDMVQYFIDRGIRLNQPTAKRGTSTSEGRSPYYKPLLAAARNGRVGTTKLLLEHGADPNWYAPEDTALMAAVHRGHVPVTRLLLDYGAEVDDGCPPPIVLAARNEDMEMFRFLRSRGATLNTPESGSWAMAFAECSGLDSMIEELSLQGVEGVAFSDGRQTAQKSIHAISRASLFNWREPSLGLQVGRNENL